MAYVKNGEIVLNVNYSATKDLHIDNEAVVFTARFSGVAHAIYVPMNAIKGIFARENAQGMFFEASDETQSEPKEDVAEDHAPKEPKSRPNLTIVK